MDKLILDTYLLILKSTVEVYIHGTLESSNKDIKELLKNGLEETLKAQEKTYDLMTEYGFYKVNNTDKKQIDKVYKKVIKKSSD